MSWLRKHELLVFFGVAGLAAFALIEAAKQVAKGVGQAIVMAASPNQLVPAGSIVLFNNGQSTTTTTDTDVGTLQANGATQYTTPDGSTFSVPAAPIPGAFA